MRCDRTERNPRRRRESLSGWRGRGVTDQRPDETRVRGTRPAMGMKASHRSARKTPPLRRRRRFEIIGLVLPSWDSPSLALAAGRPSSLVLSGESRVYQARPSTTRPAHHSKRKVNRGITNVTCSAPVIYPAEVRSPHPRGLAWIGVYERAEDRHRAAGRAAARSTWFGKRTTTAGLPFCRLARTRTDLSPRPARLAIALLGASVAFLTLWWASGLGNPDLSNRSPAPAGPCGVIMALVALRLRRSARLDPELAGLVHRNDCAHRLRVGALLHLGRHMCRFWAPLWPSAWASRSHLPGRCGSPGAPAQTRHDRLRHHPIQPGRGHRRLERVDADLALLHIPGSQASAQPVVAAFGAAFFPCSN